MKREDAITNLGLIYKFFIKNPISEEQQELVKETFDTAYKALVQESPLNKIKAEIDNINLNEVALKYENRFYGFQQEVIEIIDKYAAESGEIK